MEKEFENFQTIKILKTESVDTNLDISSASIDEKPLAKPYVIVFINRSNRCFVKYRLQFVGSTSWTSWTSISICRTCSLATLQDCFNAKQWRELFVIDCDAKGFILELETAPNAQGISLRLTSDVYYPNCTYAGGVVPYEE